MTVFIKAKSIILPESEVESAYLEITDKGQFGRIVTEKPEGEIVDYSDFHLAPGLVDTHIHGYASHDVMDNDFEGIKVISEGLLSCGVTSWLPTTLTDTTENLDAVCETIGTYAGQETGAKIQGIFLEGPFFTEKYKGAQNPKYMSDPSIEKLDNWNSLSKGLVNKIAIAPEREGVKEFIEFANSKAIHTALAHSDATYTQAEAAVEAGANIFVHVYNGMSGLHHREPGMVGAALNLKNVYAEMICDGHHVHPVAAEIVVKARGAEETVLITDCMRAGGMGEGESRLGEFEVVVKDGTARLKESGSLAGSILELIEAVQNVVKWGLVSLPDALRMASLAPARSVNIDHICGRIAEGRAADFIVVDDAGRLQATYLDGVKRFG
ncbi:TPA: N-acetylglucosamine-6-phosphate deacetylase [Streptococcus suis]|uniref:N-acetylglucosamine-6-phosphate deacetylase n=1 Tax=Streptococcus suis TaxID=1307 RepID=A0A0Z8D6M1_STRSU|nr:N-acetylglucosamine-6-phosphate deacetylase [Streptococcus suis]AEB81694.1 N-acetylglucosamine-6-phosphate deacetylase [Streptococcus suis ST3]AGW87623.1 N-acetylglucosamine-6-phosphate deacetylase [Streptococcus suis YB51]AHF59001.1 N-acetylglucosamine-6-phosphate deacetylase [Streptococcus suis 05HAS68]ALA29032.1 N-acetylglucosamine-6-phosphate deacetylase [Streptococcus suis]AMU78713.1 N-acetylglucosamine-6-phosphate deacetylase [Streptococcus suis]